uniref:Tc1-like transposase DDE domain-containing protein n=1 Tax=Anopheles funestus TaxID=62324 RepID=A0A182RB67_ANOFN
MNCRCECSRIRGLAFEREIDVTPNTVKHALNEDLRYTSYKRRSGQLLAQKGRKTRLAHAKKLLNMIKHPAEPETIWFFEKDFCQDQKLNVQINRWLAYCAADVPWPRATNKIPTNGHGVRERVIGRVMSPHFFDQGLKLNAKGYVKLLDTVAKPWITKLANARPYVWQQDSAPCHTVAKLQKWLKDNFYDFTTPNVWPPSSPDLNPMDYCV